MSSSAPDLLREAATSSVSEEVRREVQSASPVIQQQLSGPNFRNAAVGRITGAGAVSAPAAEQDLASLTYDQILDRFGPVEGPNMVAGLVTAENRYRRDLSGTRSTGQAIGDTATDVASGLFSGLGGIAALGAGLISDDAGVALAQGVQSGTEWLEGTQSPDLQARRRVFASRNALNARDNELIHSQEEPNDGSFLAGVKQIGRDALSTVGSALSDPTMAASIIANAVGSFGAAGGVGKGIRAAGSLAPRVVRHAGTLGIGLTEAAGGYQQTAAEISAMGEEALQAGSEHYRELRGQGWTHEDARTEVANRTGLTAAVITAPAALAAGRLVDKFQMNPMRVPNLMAGLANIGKETIEEAIQGGAGQVAQNLATSLLADSSRTLRHGVGEQVGLGALGGFGAAGSMQAPGMAGRVLAAAGRGAGQGVVALADRIGQGADTVRAANDAASPVSDTATRTAIEAVKEQVQAPEVEASLRQAIDEAPNATPESQAQGNTFVDRMKNILSFDQQDLVNHGAPASVLSATDGATDKLELIGRLSSLIEQGASEGVSPEDIHFAAAVMTGVQGGVLGDLQADPSNFNLPAGTPGRELLEQFTSLLAQTQQSPGYRRAMGLAERTLTQAQEKGELTQDITAQSLETPEGQQAAQVAAAAAVTAPDSANLKTVTQMLAHSVGEGPKLRLTPAQRNSLLAVKALLDGEQMAKAAQEKLGHLKPVDRVSQEILTNEKDTSGPKVSATSQALAISAAMSRGDVKGAKQEMKTLGLLVKHMQHKVMAFNQHFEQGGGQNVPYEALSLRRKTGESPWYTNKAGHGVHPTNPNSVEQAQRTAFEAQRLVEIYNGIADGFPDLDVKHASAISLDARLDGKPAVVAAEFKSGVRTRGPKAETKPTTPTEETKPAPEKTEAAEPAAVPTPAQKDVPAEVKDEAPEPVPEAAPKETIDTAFPGLIGSAEGSKIVNQLKRAFTLPKEKLSRLMGVKSPLDTLRQALSSPQALAKFLDGKGNRRRLSTETASAYQDHLDDADKIIATMETNFQAFLEKRFKGDIANIEKDPRFTSFYNMKMLNIAELKDGKLSLNQELLESAVLAGMQWLLTGQQMGSSWMTNEELADMLGVSEDQVASMGDVRNWMNTTIGSSEATRQLADKISSFWGLKGVSSADDALVKGIPEAVAKEVIRAMVEHDMLVQSTVKVLGVEQDGETSVESWVVGEGSDPKDQKRVHGAEDYDDALKLWKGKGDKPKTYARLAFPDFAANGALSQDLSLIERAVLITPKDVNYVAQLGEKPPVATHQMNNPMVQNTADDLAQIEAHSKVEFKINEPLVDLFTALDETGAVELFGHGDLAGRKLNKNHETAMKGKNLSIQSAHIQLMSFVEEAKAAAAGLPGTKMADIGFRFAFNVSKVGRLQMLGRFSPQASKYMREALVATWADLDLAGNAGHQRAFQLALGQALGVKVHQMPYATASEETDDRLAKLRPAINLLGSYQESKKLPMNAVAVLKETFEDAGVELSPIALHALMEFSRLERTEDPTSFRTGLSLEADGVTNGVINAINLMTIGEFTEHQIKNMAKGGRFLNVSGPSTMNEQRAVDKADMYKEGTNAFETFVKELRGSLKTSENKPVLEVMDYMLTLMNIMFPKGEVEFDKDAGELTIGRGVMKNPMTISIYGSGNKGIAQKLVGVIEDSLYERMSNVTERQAALPGADFETSLFANVTTDDAEAKAMFAKFFKAFSALTNTKVNTGKNGLWTKADPQPKSNGDWAKFTLTRKQQANMKQNLLHLFVGPMADAIHTALGESVFESGQLIIKATQAQSYFLMDAFNRAKKVKLAELKAADPTRTADSYLSSNEQRELLAGLAHLAPLISTKHQTFFPAGTMKAEDGDLKFSTDLLERQSTPAYAYGPGPAGVAAMPGLNIGFGDGRAIQAALVTNQFPRSLAIFDGVHGPLDTIEEDSRNLNEAVLKSWQGNPLAALYDSYSKFMKAAAKEPMSDDMRKDLTRSFRQRGDEGVLDEATIRERMAELEEQLLEGSLSVQARQMTLANMSQKVDQMAAAGAPFVKTGDDLQSTTHADIAAELNASYLKNLAGLRDTQPRVIPENTQSGMKKAPGLGRIDKATGVRVISGLALSRAMRAGVPEIMDLIRRTRAVSGYTVVHGTVEQLEAYSQAKGLSLPNFGPGTKGLTSPSESIIYLATPSLEGADLETIVHEMIHAATFEKVLEISQQLNDPKVGTASEEGKAVLRLRELMSDFMNLESSLPAHRDAMSAIKGHLSNAENDLSTRQALALNEFMAWSLANKSLAATLDAKKVNPFVKLAKDAVALIKKLILGRTVVSPADESMLSNIQFNTAIIVRSQPTVLSNLKRVTLAHTVGTAADARLTTVQETFTRIIGTHLSSNPTDLPLNQAYANVNNTRALQYAKEAVAGGFNSMSQQAQTTFMVMVAAMATEAEIDPAAMAKAQELYAHVAKSLEVEDFMGDPKSTNPSVRARAEAQWDVIMGQSRTRRDRHGRSTLLPTFLALATVDDGFRKVLAKKTLPKTAPKGVGLDGVLENAANQVLTRLSDRMAGTSKSLNVQQAIDDLSRQIQKTSMEQLTLLDHVMTPAGNLVDKTNEKVTQGLQGAASSLSQAAEKLEAKHSNRVTRLVTQAAHITEAIVNEERAAQVGMGLVHMMNELKGWEPIRKIVIDMVGRTENNAGVYDLIKKVRSMVSQTRQRYREDLPSVIARAFTSTKPSKAQWNDLFHGMGKTDLASLAANMKHDDIFELFEATGKNLNQEMSKLETKLKAQAGRDWKTMRSKAMQLAVFMKTGNAGEFLLRNAAAVSSLAGLNRGRAPAVSKDASFVTDMDKLITLYAIDVLDAGTKKAVHALAQADKAGMTFTLSYLEGQRKDEMDRVANSNAGQMNHYKGHLPSLAQQGVSLIVADDARYSELLEKSYKRVGDYGGSSADYDGPNAIKRGYYLAPVSARSPYNQGIMQNVTQTASGVDADTGFTDGMVAGRVRSPRSVLAITKRLINEGENAPGNENLMPVFNQLGRVVAYERAIDPAMSAKVEKDTHLARMIGVWRGRQAEEGIAMKVNLGLVDEIHKQWKQDMSNSAMNNSQYIDIFDVAEVNKDPVLRDAVELLSKEVKDYARTKFGEDTFFIRRDMLDDTLGYRNASVGDAWNGVTRWDPKVQEAVRKLAISIWGNEAYRKVVNAERIVQGVVKDLKVLIVVKSVVVPVANSLSNMHHLVMRGVPILDIARGMPRKLTEIQSYTTNRVREIQLEADLRAAESSTNTVQANKIRSEIRSITDANRRMTIWPLIEAGEFSAISDAGISRDEILLTTGKLNEYIEKKLSELPGPFETLGRYGMVTRDTALFQGLQKAVDYGDFIAKAILYDHLTKKRSKTKDQALGQITEEFVNYDRLPGRFRGTMEDLGLLWFYNFKIRSVKVALSIIRNNPVHALMAGTFLPDPGTVLDDNLISKGLSGGLPYSIGPGMGARALGLNPWANLVH